MKVIGTIEDIIFRNDTNNYTVLAVKVDSKIITVVGKFPQVSAGLGLELEGEMITNSKYGEQFNAKEIVVLQPTNSIAIERYLSSGIIKGIGPVTAKKIVEHFGADTLTILEYNPLRLSEIKGISKAKAIEIGETYQDCKVMQEAVMFLQSHSISTNMALKIYNVYKSNTVKQVKTNPYKLVEDIDGIGFTTADAIAQKTGIDPLSEERIKAGILHCLKQASEKEGHTYLPKSDLISNCLTLLNFYEADQSRIENVLDFITLDGSVKYFTYKGNEIIMLAKLYYQELYLSRKLSMLSQNIFENNLNHTKAIEHYQSLNKIDLNDDQKNAVQNALVNGAVVITGGPGTGKTTILKCILSILEQENKKVLLCAPTGRASKRMSESTGKEAKTIHRALEMASTDSMGAVFHRNESNPIDADIVIIDEMSMVDVSLLYHLLKAIKNTTRLIMVGDKDQLQSVGAGNVLRDIIESNKICVSFLHQIYRQDKDSLIIVNAHLINSGKMPTIDNMSKDFFYENEKDLEVCSEKIVDLVSTRIPNYFKIPVDKIQVLAPMRAGVCGIDNLNKKLQMVINPYFKGIQVADEFTKYHIGDKVMQIVNNYDINYTKTGKYGETQQGTGVYNGDIGKIIDIAPNTYDTTVEFDDGKVCVYPKTELNQLTLAYAITIHKSQGSEFDAVVIPLVPGAPIIITRNLLYTAITRAKKVAVLIGPKQHLSRMIYNNYT
ncbi:MAG: ATP-dependent RecD-like DNA helicase, partial [Clostridia bacterium]|nr:ATP-dependent RecD-like DNA helicase [Clostridia bacterium]